MSKKKAAGILAGIVFLVLAVIAVLYFTVAGNLNELTDFYKLREGMKPADTLGIEGVSLYVPEDYEKSDNEYFATYVRDGATVMLGTDDVSNDLENYAYYAVKKYEEVTDTFSLKEEYTEMNGDTEVHVVIFDYSLALENGVKSLSCLTAFEMSSDKSYVLTCTSDASDFSLYLEDFTRIYKTMVLTDTGSNE